MKGFAIKSLALAAVMSLVMLSVRASAETLRFGHANNSSDIAYDLFQEFADRVSKPRYPLGAVRQRVS